MKEDQRFQDLPESDEFDAAALQSERTNELANLDDEAQRDGKKDEIVRPQSQVARGS